MPFSSCFCRTKIIKTTGVATGYSALGLYVRQQVSSDRAASLAPAPSSPTSMSRLAMAWVLSTQSRPPRTDCPCPSTRSYLHYTARLYNVLSRRHLLRIVCTNLPDSYKTRRLPLGVCFSLVVTGRSSLVARYLQPVTCRNRQNHPAHCRAPAVHQSRQNHRCQPPSSD